MSKLVRVHHVITNLATGGAQMMLYKLLSAMNRSAFEAEVFSLTDIGTVGKKIQELGIPVHSLGMKRGLLDTFRVWDLARCLRQRAPDVIQTWLDHGNFLGGVAAKVARRKGVVWGVRQSSVDRRNFKKSTFRIMKACSKLSGWLPSRIVCCSETSRVVYREFGYAPEKMVVIPNGFDTELYRPDATARQVVRREINVPEDTPLIGVVGRFHAQKDHETFVRAAGILHMRVPEVRFLLCGEGVTWENGQLADWIREASLTEHCHLLGRRDDMPRVDAALDLLTLSSSFGEGFPNAVGEAMACGVPCAVTDVGDSATIVGDTGRSVPPRNPQALAEAMLGILELGPEGRKRLGLAARRRVVEHYSIASISEQYHRLYSELAAE